MLTPDIIVIGASAGGIEALGAIVAGLPKDFSASVFVVMHTGPDSPGILDVLLRRAGSLPAITAKDKQPIEDGYIFMSSPLRARSKYCSGGKAPSMAAGDHINQCPRKFQLPLIQCNLAPIEYLDHTHAGLSAS